MKILKASICPNCGETVHGHADGYNIYLDNGDVQHVAKAREYEIFLDGQSLKGVAVGASEEDAFADVIVQKDGSEEGYAGPLPKPGSPIANWHLPLTIRRLTGKVEIRKLTS